jgi:acylphosphatase
MKTNVHVMITGRVQGVWFRATTRQKAEQIGITGWVRNTRDGCVEAIFEGEENCVKEMIEWCHRGPPLAKIENVEVKNQSLTNGFDGFSIKY